MADIVALTEAGLLGGKMGTNEAVIGFAVNGLSTPADSAGPERTPSYVRSRQLLDADRVDQAVEAVIGSLRPTSRNYLLGHTSGELINIETTPTDSDYSHPQDGTVTHTNHFVATDTVISTLERHVPYSVTRKARATRSFDTCERPVTTATINSCGTRHRGFPSAFMFRASNGSPQRFCGRELPLSRHR